MKNKLQGTWGNMLTMDCNYPEIANVTTNDYVAKSFPGPKNTEVQKPFFICHSEPVTLRLQPWLGDAVTWSFTAGPYPMPIRSIISHEDNTAQLIQICY